MLSVPTGDPRRWYDFLRKQLLDRESREDFEFPAQYMFKNVPHLEEHMDDPVGYVLSQMDEHGIAKAMLGTSHANEGTQRIIKDHPGTPWEILARREQATIVGLTLQEAFVGERSASPRRTR